MASGGSSGVKEESKATLKKLSGTSLLLLGSAFLLFRCRS